jgi:hypothetical protein
LHDHGHAHITVIDAVAGPVDDGAVGEQRRPAAADVVEDGVGADDVEVAVVLAGERRRGEVFGCRTRANGERNPITEPMHGGSDRRLDLVWDVDVCDVVANLSAYRADRRPVVG